jgi:hypothetical protein
VSWKVSTGEWHECTLYTHAKRKSHLVAMCDLMLQGNKTYYYKFYNRDMCGDTWEYCDEIQFSTDSQGRIIPDQQ